MKIWLFKILFKKELLELGRLSSDMKSKNPDEWQKGFICGLHHAALELVKE